MNRYESYQDSGIQWLGEVPTHWEIKRLKFLAKIQNGADYKHIETNEGYPVIGSGGQFAYASHYLYKGKSVLLGRKGTIDKPLYVDDAFWTVDTMYYTEIFKNTYPKFFYYLVLTVDFKKYSTQTALPSMTQTALNNLIFAVPDYEEQTAIADYLDNKLGEIDALISKQETLLAKLAEQRTATITQAVTKGLNPDVPMKDSGVAWLGEVPRGWGYVGLSKLFYIKAGGDLLPEFFSQEKNDEHPYPIYTNANDASAIYGYTSKKRYSANSITVSGRGDIGFAVYRNHDFDAIIRLLVLSPLKNLDCRYYTYSINALLNFKFESSAVAQLSTVQLSQYKLLLPPLAEQTAIANYLDEQTAHIDRLSDTVNQTIASLKEYRSALITQAVTGKIKVI